MTFDIYAVNKHIRRTLIGSLAGLAASYALVMTQETDARAVVLGVLVGIVYAVAFRPTAARVRGQRHDGGGARRSSLDLLRCHPYSRCSEGEMPEWTNGEMRALSPEFIGWILYGGVLGLVTQALNDIALARLGPEPGRV